MCCVGIGDGGVLRRLRFAVHVVNVYVDVVDVGVDEDAYYEHPAADSYDLSADF